MKAYKFKLKPCKKVADQLATTLDLCRELYNAALQERRDAYQMQKQSLNYHTQRAQLPEIKALRDDMGRVHSQVLQDVLQRLEKTFAAFFRRVKACETPGYPRYKGKYRYTSFTYPQSGFKLVGNKLTLSKIGSCRLRLSRQIAGKIKTCSIRKQVDGWFVIFTVEENQSRWLPKTNEVVGIDVGIENFATLSTGEVIDNPKYYRQAEKELRIAQRQVSKKKRGGKNRQKARIQLAKKHQKIANLRRDFFHKRATNLLREFDDILVEELHIKGMVKNHHLAKSISDASWATFLQILTDKAESAGRRVWKVAAQFISQDCSQCGARVKKSLAVREHRCIGCGFVAHRDHNAALNIKARIAPFARVRVASPDDQRISIHTCYGWGESVNCGGTASVVCVCSG